MTYNLLHVAKDMVTGQITYVDKRVADARMTVCVACPKIKPMQVCGECGCYLPAKVKFEQSSCPIGKW